MTVATEADEKLVANERAKLTATWLNAVSVAAIAVGGIAPTVAIFTGTATPVVVALLIIGWGSAAGALHWAGRWVLGSLRA